MTDHKKRQEIPVNRVDVLDDLGVAPDQAKFDAAREAESPHLTIGDRVVKERPGRVVALADHLDALEFAAREAPGGTWHGHSSTGEVQSDAQIHPIAESCSPSAHRHIIATQPAATLALIAKLRAALAVIQLYKKDRNQWTREDIDLARSLEWIEVP